MTLSILTRSDKGAPLTHAEMDTNLTNIKTEVDRLGVETVTPDRIGLMSTSDFLKLQNIEPGANLYVHPIGNGNLHVPFVRQSDVGAFLRAKDSTTGVSEWVDVTWNMVTGKPTFGTASGYDVPETGDAGSNQVVLGSDSRLALIEQLDPQTIQDQLDAKIESSLVGTPNGLATLDGTGKVPSSQLPSYVDDIEEYINVASFPLTGEAGKLYVAQDVNKVYRWSGTVYVAVSSTGSTLNVGDGTSNRFSMDIATERINFVAGANVNINYDDVSNSVTIATTGTLSGNADTASSLLTARTITATGDASWFVTFDGSTDVSNALTLATTGVTPGTYSKVTVDAKGRVTLGAQLDTSDLPSVTVDSSNITGIISPANLGTGTANNTTYLRGDGTWQTIDTSGTGTVTSVGLSLPAMFTVTGSPVTTSGTLTATLASQTANTVFAAPNGSNGAPSFRTLTATDIPNLPATKITTGVFSTAQLGTGTADITTYLRGDGTWATVSTGTNIEITNDTTTDATLYPTFGSATSGTLSGLSVSSTKLQFNPNTGTLSATNINATSDIRAKTNIKPLSYGSSILNQLEPVSFDWADGSGKSFGFIAQELAKVLPEAVDLQDGDRLSSVNYGILTSVLVKVLQEQQEAINTLVKEIEILKGSI